MREDIKPVEFRYLVDCNTTVTDHQRNLLTILESAHADHELKAHRLPISRLFRCH